MSFKHYLLIAGYYPLRAFNKIGRRRTSRLRVLLYHNISPTDEANFECQLRWLSKSWQFVTPEHFSEMVDGTKPVERDSLLLTFDDGFMSNRVVTERVLNPLGISALFFIVSNFANLSRHGDWRRFVAEKIDPGLRPEDIPNHKQNMSVGDLKFLKETGHTIGAHTANHKRLSTTLIENLDYEIIKSADDLEQSVGIKIEHFAYTFGDLSSFSLSSLTLARSRFKYIYTGLRGNNAGTNSPCVIRRDSCSPTDHPFVLGAFLEGGVDRLYKTSLEDFESWVRQSD